MKHAPAQQNILQYEMLLEPTELARKFGFKSPNSMNRCLEDLGLQTNLHGEWVATDVGAKISQSHAWTRHGKTGYNLKWNVKAIEELLENY